jgi:hypothetical protein
MGEKIVCYAMAWEVWAYFDHDLGVVQAYNKIYVGYKMKTKWEIGELK